VKSNNTRPAVKSPAPAVTIRRCLHNAAHYNQRSALGVAGVKRRFSGSEEKSANNAHGAYNGSYAIMRAEIKGASMSSTANTAEGENSHR
jgi:hypothetical protein